MCIYVENLVHFLGVGIFKKDPCAIDYTVVKCRIQRAEKKFDNDAYSKRVSCDLVYARERDPFSLQQKTKLNRKLTIFFFPSNCSVRPFVVVDVFVYFENPGRRV